MIGVARDPAPSLTPSSLRVEASSGGEVLVEAVRNTGVPSAFPAEFVVPGTESLPVTLRVSAYTGENAEGVAFFTTSARTRFVKDASLLFRVNLDPRCFVLPGAPTAGCLPDQTCRDGQCVSPDLETLEPYRKDWATNVTDPCKPGGPPSASLGTGQTDFGSITPEQELALERGPQGGHHLWVALRMKNLTQSGTRTEVSATEPGGIQARPAAFAFAYEKDEGGFCKLYGLRYQVDAGGDVNVRDFLGKSLVLGAKLSDPSGATAETSVTVRIAKTIQCPPGMSCG